MSIRDIRRTARRQLHDAFKVAVLYIPRVGSPALLHARDHTKFRVNAIEGAVRSGNGQMVGRQEMEPSIIFMRDELAANGVTLIRGGVISIERGEAYTLDNAEAPDDITVKWFVTAISNERELAELPVPEDLS
ncbi:hypothetical protein [Aquamicrobium zhengzhouense]|uniref:Uncharacterized protein n=1 Tax=Aquamicrobium zhengzhouense TaxID=2781738 RepID=A0ABS0S9P0_9HYPH|nr:hypothetical protein [Aquamicrobium zhengzhouense]MBI1620015.1 hypothetical protein [Aquamicrobium zhengzhouense]